MIAFLLEKYGKQLIGIGALFLIFGVLYARGIYYKHEATVAKADAIEAKANLDKTTTLIRDNALAAEKEKARIESAGKAQREADQQQSIQNAQIIADRFYAMTKGAQNETKQIKITTAKQLADLNEQLRQQSAIIASRSVSDDDALRNAQRDTGATVSRPNETSAEYYRTAFIGAATELNQCKLAAAESASMWNECHKYVTGEQSRIGVAK